VSSNLQSFPPIAGKDAVILILGSLPSAISLEKQESYGNPLNHFWRLIYALFDCAVDEDYEKKKAFVLSKKIALWDSIHSAQRQGSLDGSIKNAVPNDFLKFFLEHPNVRYIFFNGAASESVFKKHFPILYSAMPHTRLPSSSPIPTSKVRNFEDKLKEWMIVKKTWDDLA
jgi:TDG/mug DNA glycosylase family protein